MIVAFFMPEVSNWMHVEVFTVNQAAALWCGFDPSVMDMYDVISPSEAVAVSYTIDTSPRVV